jgi:phosphopantothenoylcysteine decarboxylase/phosphopantothenate--cysteine ligase
MREPVWILNALELVDCHQRLHGQRFLLTAGPTREALDPVRYLSNHSTGVMGYALAEALSFAGADVHLVSGPCALNIPPGIRYTLVESAQEMYEAVFANLVEDLYFIGVAAVADFRPKQANLQKIKKQQKGDWLLELEPSHDILAAVKAWGKAKKVIGFAAETENLIANAQAKLTAKADMIIANVVGQGQGFGLQNSALTVITQNNMKSLAPNSKLRLAAELVHCIEDLIQN